MPAFNNNDTTICPITYTLFINGTVYSSPINGISFNSGTRQLTVYTTNELHRSLNSLIFQGTNGYSTVYIDFTVDITVNQCYYATITEQPINSMTYQIN